VLANTCCLFDRLSRCGNGLQQKLLPGISHPSRESPGSVIYSRIQTIKTAPSHGDSVLSIVRNGQHRRGAAVFYMDFL
jgi:hypothetical protein